MQNFLFLAANYGSSSRNWYLVLAVVGIAVFGAGLYFWDKHRKSSGSGSDHPKSLFLELCSAHGLSRGERALLRDAAEQQGIAQPGLAFVDPRILEATASAAGEDAAAFGELRQRLFGRAIEA